MVNGATRSRVALGVKLDYRWSDNTTVTLNTSWNFFHENNDTRSHALTTTATTTLATVDANGNRVSGGLIKPGYTDTFTQIFADPNSSSALTLTSNDKSGRTYLFSPRVRHRFNDMLIDYSLSWSNSATYYDVSHNDEKYHSKPKGTITYRLANIGWAVDRSQDMIWPTIRQTQGPDLNNLANYNTLLLSQTDLRGFDTVLNGKFDLKKNISLRFPTYVKTGFSYQYQKRKLWQDPRRYNWTGPDGILGNADDNVGIAQFLDNPHIATADEDKFFKNRGGIPPWVNPYAVAQHQKDNPQYWREDIAFTSGKLTSRLFIEEKIAAAYAMGQTRFGPLSVLAGMRFEDTRDEGEGPFSRLTPEEVARRAAYVGPVTDDEQRRRNQAQFGSRFTNEGKYQFFLPGVHLKYEPIPNFVARLSWSTGVGRPAFGSIIPNTTVNDTAQTVTLSNPDLKPQYSNNGDLSLEYYFRPQGMISFGAFRKKIRDYIATNNSQFVEAGQNNGFDGQYVGYRITTSINDGFATIDGLEFNYQQQLAFLPGWTKGFGIYGNFTKLRTEGQNSNFTTGPVASAGGTIAGFLDRTGNIGLGYRGFGFDLRLQTVYRGQYLRANSTTFALVQYQVPKWTWNWKSRYTFSQGWARGWGVFLDLENIFEVPLDRIYAAYPERVISYRTFHTKIVGGITGRF